MPVACLRKRMRGGEGLIILIPTNITKTKILDDVAVIEDFYIGAAHSSCIICQTR